MRKSTVKRRSVSHAPTVLRRAASWALERLESRVMFAGDWPVVDLGSSIKAGVETVKRIVRDDAASDQAKLFRDNAIKIYGLS